ncbi:MAG: hypothetical protein NTV56_00820 [Alphaproteobacteria bacterium]|nr:hypothetical protein [Alphaproteobacteria bacterium]
MMSLRAEAAQARAFGLSLLAAEFAAKIGAARHRYRGDELIAVLAALYSEQTSAERALATRLSAEARQRRRDVLTALKGAARAITKRAPAARAQRPRRRPRGTPRKDR